MNIARVLAGYSLGQADILRKAMGKKKLDLIEEHRAIFLKGAGERGFDQEVANDVYSLMASFAEYGFNKSHAVAYSYISFQTAFLKFYYPACFFAGLLSTELSNTDKVTIYINDAKNYDVQVLAPDVNESLWLFNVIGNNIRFGMGAIKNVGEAAVDELVREREENGPFKGFIDFCTRVSLKSVNSRVVESLIKVGAFDECEENLNRKTMLENSELVITYAKKMQLEKELGQVSLFDMGGSSDDDGSNDPMKMLDIQMTNDFDDREKLSYESQLMGIYVSGHPLDRYSDIMGKLASMDIAQVHDISGGDKREMVLAGLITERRDILTKKGDKMCFAQLEDLSGKIECIVFPKTFLEINELLSGDEPLLISGNVNLAEDPRKFFPSKVQLLKDQAEDRVTSIRINVKMEQLSETKLTRFKQVLLSYRGSVPAHVIFNGDDGRARLPLGQDFLVNPTPQMAARVNELFDGNSVQFIIDGRVEDPAMQ